MKEGGSAGRAPHRQPADGRPNRGFTSAGVVAPARRWASARRDWWEIRRDPTYRRLASSYELPDGSRRVYCYHVRKTAGTSLHLSFMALGGEPPLEVYRRMSESRLHRTISGRYAFVSYHPRLLSEGAYFYGRSHRPMDELSLPPRTFTVTILRDPVARVHSYFDYLVAGDRPDTPGPVRRRERVLASGGFDSFLDGIPVERLLAQLRMFSVRFDVAEAADRIAGSSSVFFTEDYVSGLAELGRRLELPLEVHRARVTGERSALTTVQTERLRNRLEPEYELLRQLREGGIGSRAPDPA